MEFNTIEKIKESKCFGIAWDGTVKECKLCEVANKCKAKTIGDVKETTEKKAPVKEESTNETMKPVVPRPEPKVEEAEKKEDTKPAKKVEKKEDTKPAKKKATKPKEVKTYSDDMPSFKDMDLEYMLELAKERGIDLADFDKYSNIKIKKMRVTMALKKTYEI